MFSEHELRFLRFPQIVGYCLRFVCSAVLVSVRSAEFRMVLSFSFNIFPVFLDIQYISQYISCKSSRAPDSLLGKNRCPQGMKHMNEGDKPHLVRCGFLICMRDSQICSLLSFSRTAR